MILKNLMFTLAMPLMLAQASCGKVAAAVFGPKTPREAYERKVEETPEGKRWKQAAETAVLNPVSISLPYQQKGYFPDSLQLALGLQFKAVQGAQVRFELDKSTATSFPLYADLFLQEEGISPALLYSADTAAGYFTYDIETEGNYVLRLQPEVLRGGQYKLSITQGPSIGFPVTDTKGNVGSFWGADRDGGKRRHEGVDIFAKKGSPAVAALDGYITGVQETPIGGKVVWLRPEGKDYTLYYAHLDRQDVQTGQVVRKGDQLGTVGNTGNARTTPAHLHFGVYTFRGPVDPLPYVDKRTKQPTSLPAKSLVGVLQKLSKGKSKTVVTDNYLTPLAVTAKGYLAANDSGQVELTPFSSVKLVPTAANTRAVVAIGGNSDRAM
jgi:peptidoglycan LD-endopeptidase LytH